MNHNKLDDFIRQEVEASDFTMQEQDWLRMSAILDEKETKKRPGFWRWFSFSGIIILLGLGTYLLSMQKESDNDYTQSQQEYTRNEQSMPTKKETSQTKESEIQKEEHKVDEELINQQNNTQTQSNQNSNQMATSNQNDELIKSETSVPLLENNPAEKKIVNTSSKTTLQTSTALNDESTNHTKQKSSNSSTSNKSLAVVTKSKKSNKSTQIKKTAFTSTSTEAPSDYKTHQSKLEIEPTLQTRKSNDGMQHRTAIDTNHYTVIRKNDGVIRNPRYVAGLENYIPVQLDSVTVIRYQAPKAAIDLHPTSQVLNHDSAQKMFEKHAFELYFLGGMYMNKAFKGNVDNPQAWAFSPYVGIGIEKQFTRKLTMATHIGFTYFNGLNSQLSVKNYQYGFGLDSTTTTVTHKKLFQLYLPIHVYYEWMKHHAILFGLGVSYQPEVYSKVSTTEMTNNVGFAGNSTKQISTQSTHEYGYRGGFNSMDVFAQIGYSYQIWNGLMLQAAYQQGFMDNTKNNYFKNSLNNTQTRISIGLKYNFKRL